MVVRPIEFEEKQRKCPKTISRGLRNELNEIIADLQNMVFYN